MSRKAVLPGLVLALAGTACGTDPASPRVDRDSLPLFRTDSMQYALRKVPDGREVIFDVEFTNQTTRIVYFANCLGDTRPQLQKRVGEAWTTVWSPARLSCRSQPVTVMPGATYQSQVPVFGADSNSNVVPKFAAKDLNGTFRLIWSGAVYDYQQDGASGEQLPEDHRVSNTFSLTSPP